MIVVCETWIKRLEEQIYKINGYQCVFSSRESGYGGIAIYTKLEPMNVRFIVNEPFNLIDLEMELCDRRKLIVLAAYRPPNDENFNEFTIVLEERLSLIRSNWCLLTGDLNVDFSRDSNKRNVLQDIFQSFGLQVINNHPTRPQSGTLIDYFVSNFTMAAKHAVVTMNTTFPTDHCALICNIATNKIEKQAKYVVRRLINDEGVKFDLENMFESGSWKNDDPEILAKTLVDNIHEVLDKNTIEQRVRRTEKKSNCPWMTIGLARLIRKKDNMSRKSKRYPHDQRIKQKLSDLNRLVQQQKTYMKRKYYHDLFNNCNSNKTTWRHLNEVLGRTQNDDKVKQVEDENGTVLEGQTAAEKLNDYFCMKGEELAASIRSYPPRDINSLGTLRQMPQFSQVKEATENEVLQLINSLNTEMSPGDDGITNIFLKRNKEIMAKIICALFNECCVKNGVFPEVFKLAKVIPIPKAGRRGRRFNLFRPISLLSCLGKVIEKLLYRRLMNEYEQNCFLFENQFGFRQNASTTVACLEMINHLQKCCDQGKTPTVVFFDLTAAFDTVDHNILLRKLSYSGVSGRFHDLMRSYLTGRKQYTQVGEFMSSTRSVTVGTPQGSCMSTLNYLVYINDIGQLPIRGSIRCFADDKAMMYDEYDQLIIQQDMRIFAEFLRINKLTENLEKTKFVVFNHPDPRDCILMYNDINIERVDHFRYLGLEIDQQLNFTYHISELCNYVSRVIGVLYRVANFLPTTVLMRIYNSMINSKLSYMISSYGTAIKSNIDRLFVLQKRALKIALKLRPDYSTFNLFTVAAQRTLPLRLMFERSTAMLTYQMLHGLTLNSMELQFLPTRHNTRGVSQGRLLPRKPRTTRFGQSCFEFVAPRLYNTIPHTITQAPSLSIFKRQITELLQRPNNISRAI